MHTYANKPQQNHGAYNTRKTASKPQGHTRQQNSDSALEDQFKVIQQMADTSRRAKQAQTIQRTIGSRATSTPPVANNNTGLPDKLKTGIENLSGYSMDDVKVHYNSSKPAQLNVHAYTQGTDIYLAPGQEQYLPDEASHLAQQKQRLRR